MKHGKAPVSVTDIYTALATEPAGVKPRPVSPLSEEMVSPLVEVSLLCRTSRTATALEVINWQLIPHMAKRVDDDGNVIIPERAGALVFWVELPPGYRLERDAAEVAADLEHAGELKEVTLDAAGVPGPPVSPEIAEFSKVDPAIFQSDPDRHSANMRKLHTKAAPGQADPM